MATTNSSAATFGPADSPDVLASVSAILHGTDMPALVGPDSDHIPLPPAVFEALKDVVDTMQQGKGITVVPHDARLTTQQVAEFLGLSRPTVVALLENGRIPFERPGRHRRVKLADVIIYQDQHRQERDDALDEITRASAEDPSTDTFVETR